MADNEQQTTGLFSNDILKEVFQDLHLVVVNNINTSSVINSLFAARVISNNEVSELQCEKNPREKCRHLFIILHKAQNPKTFVELRRAIDYDKTFDWLVKKIDEKYQLMISKEASVEPQVTPVRSNPSLTPLNGDTGDVTELNRVIDDLRSNAVALTAEVSKLLEENNRLQQELESVQKSRNDAGILKIENFRLSVKCARLKKINKRLFLERYANEMKMKLIDYQLANIFEKMQKPDKSAVTPELTENLAASGVSDFDCNETSTSCSRFCEESPSEHEAAPSESESRELIADLLEQPEDMWSTYDVLEPILLKVAVKLFKVNRLHLFLPRPDVTTLITVNSVCCEWWEVITGRKVIRRRLKLTFGQSTVLPLELFKAAVLLRHRLVDIPHKTSRDADVIVLQSLASVSRRWKAAFSESGDLRRRRLKRLFHYYPQLLITLDTPPKYCLGRPCHVTGLVMLEKHLYVVYLNYNKVQVFVYDHFNKIKDIEVQEMKSPIDMVGSSVTSQLFISDYNSDVIWRVDSRTGVSDVFIKTGNWHTSLSLVENRLLVTSHDSLLMFDIVSGERMRKIPFIAGKKRPYRVFHAIESNRDSFFVSHSKLFNNYTVSEIDTEGRVIRVFDNKQQLDCGYMAFDSVGRLLVVDWMRSVFFFDEHLQNERILIDNKRLGNAQPWTLNYNKKNNRLAVGLNNGQVKIFEY